MSDKHWSAGHHGVRQWSGDGQRVGAARRARWTVAIAVPVLLAVCVATLALSAGSKNTGNQKLAGAVSFFLHHRPVPLPMPTARAAAAAPDCRIIVPPEPLSAQGLATPYQLAGAGCSMANVRTQAFVQATIIDPATGHLSVYEPLVVDQGTTPAIAPVVPTLPADAVVTIDFGSNGANLTQVASGGGQASSLRQGNCVNGLPGSVFGQASYCNAAAFFRVANTAITAGTLTIPAVGTATDGQPCPTTRSFTMIGQDQSGDVTSKYLLTATGHTAQDNPANVAALPAATAQANGSDNALLDYYLDPALGCTAFTAPDLSDAGTNGTSEALDELQAAAAQRAPVALVPVNDPMTEVNGAFSIPKTNRYRAGFDQPALPSGTNVAKNAKLYCTDMMNTQTASLWRDQKALTAAPAADPPVGSNLFTFMAARLSASFSNLGCGHLGLTNPINLRLGANGVATAATFGSRSSPATSPDTPAAPSLTARATAPPATAAQVTASPVP